MLGDLIQNSSQRRTRHFRELCRRSTYVFRVVSVPHEVIMQLSNVLHCPVKNTIHDAKSVNVGKVLQQSSSSLLTRKVARSFYLTSALWMQADRLKRMVKSVIIADKHVFLEWNAKETQRLMSNGDSHDTYCIVRALAERTRNGVVLPVYKQDGVLTRGDEERELR